MARLLPLLVPRYVNWVLLVYSSHGRCRYHENLDSGFVNSRLLDLPVSIYPLYPSFWFVCCDLLRLSMRGFYLSTRVEAKPPPDFNESFACGRVVKGCGQMGAHPRSSRPRFNLANCQIVECPRTRDNKYTQGNCGWLKILSTSHSKRSYQQRYLLPPLKAGPGIIYPRPRVRVAVSADPSAVQIFRRFSYRRRSPLFHPRTHAPRHSRTRKPRQKVAAQRLPDSRPRLSIDAPATCRRRFPLLASLTDIFTHLLSRA
ncbi:hypothetical protein B0H16DRAFT_267000 [Mycena metata]|uniref:Uncharacterized protein n=1 Tax=Mycena metata TaxID=1033252 RepID=A0AAD7HR60_9AGAR|nr:hypothetical protein B0H16DRAFT_267000 [Mycena metata]